MRKKKEEKRTARRHGTAQGKGGGGRLRDFQRGAKLAGKQPGFRGRRMSLGMITGPPTRKARGIGGKEKAKGDLNMAVLVNLKTGVEGWG